jgi:hypothetical protein
VSFVCVLTFFCVSFDITIVIKIMGFTTLTITLIGFIYLFILWFRFPEIEFMDVFGRFVQLFNETVCRNFDDGIPNNRFLHDFPFIL